MVTSRPSVRRPRVCGTGKACPALSSTRFANSCSVAGSPAGSPSQTTQHHPLQTPARVTVTRRHHPLRGRSLEIFREGRNDLTVWLADGSRIRMPRRWTDADGAHDESSVRLTVFTVDALRALLVLVDALKRRPVVASLSSGRECAYESSGKPEWRTSCIDNERYGSVMSPTSTPSGSGSLRPADATSSVSGHN